MRRHGHANGASVPAAAAGAGDSSPGHHSSADHSSLCSPTPQPAQRLASDPVHGAHGGGCRPSLRSGEVPGGDQVPENARPVKPPRGIRSLAAADAASSFSSSQGMTSFAIVCGGNQLKRREYVQEIVNIWRTTKTRRPRVLGSSSLRACTRLDRLSALGSGSVCSHDLIVVFSREEKYTEKSLRALAFVYSCLHVILVLGYEITETCSIALCVPRLSRDWGLYPIATSLVAIDPTPDQANVIQGLTGETHVPPHVSQTFCLILV